MIKGITFLGKGLGIDLGLELDQLLLQQSFPKRRRLLANEANKQKQLRIEAKQTPKIK